MLLFYCVNLILLIVLSSTLLKSVTYIGSQKVEFDLRLKVHGSGLDDVIIITVFYYQNK